MTKLKFLLSLHDRLAALPQEEVEERLNFYSEMIEDRMEEGLSEEEAVSAVGSIDEIVTLITAEIAPEESAPKKALRQRQLTGWEITLLVLGFPLWFPLLIAAFAVVLSLYISLWSVVISLWAVFVSFVACAFAGILVGIGFSLTEQGLAGVAMIAAGLVCAGLGILLFFGCNKATKGTVILATKAILYVKNRISRKEAV